MGACAREAPPPGHAPDFAPPRALRVEPEPGVVLPGFDGSIRVRFDEPLADTRTLEREIVTSPAWRWRVEPGRSEVRLRPAEGWRDGVVWYARLPAGIRDLLGNRTTEPIEILFSTGPPVMATRAGGRLYDRVTGRPLRGARVLFLAADTVPYTAVSDTGGRFALPGLPPGRYNAIGFVDLNGNLRPDRALEPHDSADVQLETPTSEAVLTLRLVEPDTTPPILTGAMAVDSTTVRLEFDEPLEPELSPEAAVDVRHEETGRTWPVSRVSAGEEPSPAAPPPAPPVALPERAPEGVPEEPPREALPSRRVVVQLAEPLQEGRYRVRADGFRNLRGLASSGDTTFVYAPTEVPPAPVPEEREGAEPEEPEEREEGAGPSGGGGPAHRRGGD